MATQIRSTLKRGVKQQNQSMPSSNTNINTSINTAAWGKSGSSHRAIYHRGAGRKIMVTQTTYEGPEASKAQVCGASNNLHPSDHRPLVGATYAADPKGVTRLKRGLEGSTEAASERAVDRLYPEISFAEPQAIQFVKQQFAMQQEAQVAIPQVVVPDRGFRAAMRKLSPFSERGYLKSGLPTRPEYGNADLLYVGKYADPRPRSFRATKDSSKPESQSVLNLDESEWLAGAPSTASPARQDALSLSEKARIASITNLHGHYPGKKFYAPVEASTSKEVIPTDGGKRQRLTEEEKAKVLDAALRKSFPV